MQDLGEMHPKRKISSLLTDESALLKLGTIIAFSFLGGGRGVGTNQATPTRQPFLHLQLLFKVNGHFISRLR